MRSLILFSSLTVLLLVPSALAHHPFADEFDRNKPVTLTGDVTRFDWMNPHASLRLEGREAGGRTAQWVVELGGIDELTKSGWTKNSLKRGDKVTIQGWLAKDGSKRANADNVKMSGGETLSAASSFHLADEGQFAAAESQAAPAGTAGELPGTASPIPLSGLIGLLSLAGALVARAARC